MSSSAKRLLVMAGGTGGHVFPALSVARVLMEQGVDVTWLGTKRGIEARLVPASKIDIQWVQVEGLRGKGWLSWFKAPFRLCLAVLQSMRAIRIIKPDCVLGMGGFVSGPGGLAAWIMRKPLVIHEQNAVAGLTNSYLAKIANQVLAGFPDVKGLPTSSSWVGNPVRTDIVREQKPNGDKKLNILVLGGSQGARTLNLQLPPIFEPLSRSINIWHQTGRQNSTSVNEAYLKLGLVADVTEFIDDMAAAYEWADLLICRAGAMTIAECCAAGVPSILIPFPHSAGDHQLINARYLENVGAAIVIDNDELASPKLTKVLAELVNDQAKISTMGDAAYTLYKPNATNDVARVCQEYLHA